MSNPFHVAAKSLEDRGSKALAPAIRGEGRVAGALVAAILAAGFKVSVHDGEEFALKRSVDAKAIIAALYSTDSDSLVLRNAEGERAGSFQLVYGNSPAELIADHSDNETCNAIYDSLRPLLDREEAKLA